MAGHAEKHSIDGFTKIGHTENADMRENNSRLVSSWQHA
jgi:hypothetical protein